VGEVVSESAIEAETAIEEALRKAGEERFAARQTKWSSGPFRVTNAASLGERPGGDQTNAVLVPSPHPKRIQI